MIYGPYSTGWRDECRRNRISALLARAGLVAVALASGAFWYGVARWML